MDKRVFVWEKEFTRSLLRLAIPMALQSLMAALMHIVDNVMVSQLGNEAMAGVTQANRITFLFQLTMFGAVGGVSVFAAQYWSNRDLKSIRRVMGMGLTIAAVVAMLFALPAIFFPNDLMRLLTTNIAARQVGAQYLRIVAVGYFFQSLSLLVASILRSTEKFVLPMAASMIGIALSTALNTLLIVGRLGFPSLGASGAAMATVVGTGVEFFILTVVSYRKKYAPAARPGELKISAEFAKKYGRIALPIVINEGLWSLGIIMYSVAYGRMGDGATIVSGISVFGNIDELAFAAMRGLSYAAAVMVGIAVGSGNREQSMLYGKRFVLASGIAGAFIGGLVLLSMNQILSMYTGVTEEVLEIARYAITVYALALWMKGMCNQLIVGVLRAGGDAVFSMIVDVVPLWAICIPLVFVLGVKLGLPFWIVYPVTLLEEGLKTLICYFRMHSKKWINNLTEQPITLT